MSKVINKEVFRINSVHPLDINSNITAYKVLTILSDNKTEKLALDVLKRLNHFINIQEIKKQIPECNLIRSMYGMEEIPELTFEFLSNFDDKSENDNLFENMSIMDIRRGTQDLINKGVLFLDTDGFLVFTQGEV